MVADGSWRPASSSSRLAVNGATIFRDIQPIVSSWHNPDLQHTLELGPIMATLPTFGPECRLTGAFQTFR
jgi:hypothetical protein